MQVNDYCPVVFANQHEFEVSEKLLELRRSAIEHIGKIFLKHKKEKQIGVCLLHKHFNLFKNELLVRSFNDNQINISPKINHESKVIPYMWQFSKSSAMSSLNLYPVEFLEVNGNTKNFKEKQQEVLSDEVFLNELGAHLEKNKLDDIFGFSLIPHELFEILDGEALYETDNHEERILTIRPVKKESMQGTKTTQTLWIFSNGPKSALECNHCNVHCAVHCGVHCGTHCGSHCHGHNPGGGDGGGSDDE